MDWIALAQIGGFAFAAGALGYVARELFRAWRGGELVPAKYHDAAMERETRTHALNVELAGAVRDSAASIDKVGDAVAALDQKVDELAARIDAGLESPPRRLPRRRGGG